MTRQTRRLSLDMAVACLALLVALGGTSVAAVQLLPRASVGPAQLRSDAVTSLKVRNGALRTVDVATGQASAGPPGPKGDRGERGEPGERGAPAPIDAYTRPVVRTTLLRADLAPVASLLLRRSGAYLIWAHTDVVAQFEAVRCELRAGEESDLTERYLFESRGRLVMNLVAEVPAGLPVTLMCGSSGPSIAAFSNRARITAISVATLTG